MTRLTPEERGALIGIARAAIRARLGLGPSPSLPETGGLGERRGAFVTRHRGGELRGCIGRFEPEGPLSRTVADMAVAAASILAKVHRDRCMEAYHRQFPQYNFASHKGYATREHLEALQSWGPCVLHRRTFRGVKEWMEARR